MQIEILEAAEKKVSLERNKVVEVSETARGFWPRLNGQIGTGFTYAKGNDSTQYNLNSDIEHPRERQSAGAGSPQPVENVLGFFVANSDAGSRIWVIPSGVNASESCSSGSTIGRSM